MPVRYGRQRWMRQPDTLSFIDHTHPLADGFANPKAFFYIMSPAQAFGPGLYDGSDITLYDLTGNRHESRSAGHANKLVAMPDGYSSDISSNGPFNSGVLLDSTINSQGTIYWGQKPADAFNAGAVSGIWGANTAGSSPELTAQRFSDNNLYVGWAGFSGDNRVTIANQAKWWGYGNWAFRWINGQKSQLYHNGVLIGTASTNTTVGAFTGANTFRVGDRGGSAITFNGSLYYFGLTGTAHSPAQIEAFADNPYQMFARHRRFWAFAVAVTGNTIAVPAGSLTLTGFAPTIVQTANNVIAVPAGSLTLTGQTPTVTASNNQTVAVPLGTLTLTGQTPTVTVAANQTVQVPLGTLSLTGFAPTVTATANQTIVVPLGTLTLTGQTPTVTVGGGSPQTISVPAGSLTLTGFAPTIVQSANNVVQVPAGTLTLTGQTPTVTATANNVVQVPLGALTLSPYSPVVNPVAATASTVVVGGGPAPRRRKPHFVQIDGELFPVEDEAEAIAVLQQAQELQEEVIRKAVVQKAKPPAKPVVKASLPVADVVKAIDTRHEEALRAYLQMLDDDDEDVFLLL